MNPDLTTSSVVPITEVVRTVPEAPKVPEVRKDHWQENGFLKDNARICSDLEGESEQFLFPAEVRQLIETINNALTVDDFDRYSETEIVDFINTLRRRVPQIEREVTTFIGQITRARAVIVDSVDYI